MWHFEDPLFLAQLQRHLAVLHRLQVQDADVGRVEKAYDVEVLVDHGVEGDLADLRHLLLQDEVGDLLAGLGIVHDPDLVTVHTGEDELVPVLLDPDIAAAGLDGLDGIEVPVEDLDGLVVVVGHGDVVVPHDEADGAFGGTVLLDLLLLEGVELDDVAVPGDDVAVVVPELHHGVVEVVHVDDLVDHQVEVDDRQGGVFPLDDEDLLPGTEGKAQRDRQKQCGDKFSHWASFVSLKSRMKSVRVFNWEALRSSKAGMEFRRYPSCL